MTTPRQQARIDRMFKAALAEFSRQGFHQASVDAIAAKAEVSKATLYSHFGTKEALFLAVFERVLKDFRPPEFDPKATSLDAAARMAIRDLFTKIAGTPESVFFFHCMNSDSSVLREDLRNELSARFVAMLHGEMGKIKNAQRDGLVYKHLDVELMQHAHIGMLLQVLRYWWGQKKRIPIKRVADQFADLFLYGVAIPDTATRVPAKPKARRSSR